MSNIFWKLLVQRLILAINQVFWCIIRGVKILLPHCNRIVHKIWHHVISCSESDLKLHYRKGCSHVFAVLYAVYLESAISASYHFAPLIYLSSIWHHNIWILFLFGTFHVQVHINPKDHFPGCSCFSWLCHCLHLHRPQWRWHWWHPWHPGCNQIWNKYEIW